VPVTALWLGLMVATVGWGVWSHRSRGRWTSLAEIGARLGGSLPGRIVLLALWAFVGWHVFARYTIPG